MRVPKRPQPHLFPRNGTAGGILCQHSARKMLEISQKQMGKHAEGKKKKALFPSMSLVQFLQPNEQSDHWKETVMSNGIRKE